MEPQAVARTDTTAGGPILRRLFGRRRSPIRGAARAEATVVAIASGKGGTGKSFLASNLAAALAQRGTSLSLVDCDFGLGNAHLLLGLNPQKTLQHVLTGQARVEDILLDTGFGFDLLPGGSGVRQLASLNETEMAVVAEALGSLAANRHVLLLDTSAGLSPQVLSTIVGAHRVVVVTNPELAALTDAYALIKCVHGLTPGASFHLVVNRVARRGQGEAVYRRLSSVAERFCGSSIHYLGEIPDEPTVGLRRLGEPPLMVTDPQCLTSLAVKNVAQSMERLEGGFFPRTVSPTETFAFRLRRASGI